MTLEEMDNFEEVTALDQKGDYISAFHMLTRIAQQGSVDALYMLGVRCNGKSHDRGLVFTAYGYFHLAATRGHLDAKLEMDALAKSMTEEEIKSGHSFANMFSLCI